MEIQTDSALRDFLKAGTRFLDKLSKLVDLATKRLEMELEPEKTDE